MGSWAERTHGKTVADGSSEEEDCGARQARLQLADPTRWWLTDPGAPHLHMDKPGGVVGERSRPRNQGSSARK